MMPLMSEINHHPGSAPFSISFSGSGFLATYQLGVVQALLNYAPLLLRSAPRVYGASAGAIVAALVVCGSSIDLVRNELLEFARFTKRHRFGLMHPKADGMKWIENTLRRSLPEGAHRRANGRLHISMTRIPDGKNIIISEFNSYEDLVMALLCGCFFPFYCGLFPPCYKGVHYIDGGLTNMQPTHDPCHTLTVSPFAGETDICPSERSFAMLCVNGLSIKLTPRNVFRLTDALLPRNVTIVSTAYFHGYQDAIHYMLKNRIIQFSPNWMEDLDYAHNSEDGAYQQMVNECERYEGEENTAAKNWDLEDLPQLENPELICPEEVNNIPTPVSLEQTSFHIHQEWITKVSPLNITVFLGVINILSICLPLWMMPYLLLPISLAVWIIATFTDSFQYRLLQAVMIAYWLWQDMKPLIFLFINIAKASLRKALGTRLLVPGS